MSSMEKSEGRGIRLLKKGQKGFWKLIFSRTGVVTLVLMVQIVLLLWGFWAFEEHFPHVVGLYTAFSIFMVLLLFSSREEPTVKLTWLVVIMVAPVAGSLFYLFTKSEIGHRVLRRRLQELHRDSRNLLTQCRKTQQELRRENPGAANLTQYVSRHGSHPVYAGTDVTYFPCGEAKFEALLQELEQAERFIFLEYYIVDEGKMWGRILEILARKAQQGVDVRVMYDGTCEFYLLPRDYPQRLARLGIRCKPFSPVRPFLSTHYNYRDHRKILVIDGKTAFCGGVNLADEYINQVPRFGHWKDTALMLKGQAVNSFTLMFLQMWNVNERETDPSAFLTPPHTGESRCRGFVMPYGDSPLDRERVGEQVYLDLLNRASSSVRIMTPYLILDDAMEHALCYAAQRGVQVQLIVPGIADKKTAYALAKTHFASLLEAGVELYRYDPGFVHAKSFVCDGQEAVVGTINLDYRSLYHHFECAVWMYGVDAVADIEADFRETRDKCTRITPDMVAREKWTVRLAGFLLKFLAPLL